jgi:hypothetical protein
MIHVVPLASYLDVEDLHADRCQRADERFEDPALGRQAKFDERKDATRALDERNQGFRDADHVGAGEHDVCQHRKARIQSYSMD